MRGALGASCAAWGTFSRGEPGWGWVTVRRRVAVVRWGRARVGRTVQERGDGRVESVRLALRGLRWRLGSSLAVLVVAVVATAGAALGPLYATSAEDSLVRDGLAQEDPITTGVQSRGNVAGQTQFTPKQVSDVVVGLSDNPALDPWYAASTLALTVKDGSPRVGDRALGIAQVGWHRGQCEGVTVATGACPARLGEAMVSTRMSKVSDVPVGTRIRLGITSDPVLDTVTVVGTYDAATADPAVWGLDQPAQAAEAASEGAPDRLDEIVVDQAVMERSNGDIAAVAFRAIQADRVHLTDLPALRSAVERATDPANAVTGGIRALSVSSLPDYLDELQPQLDAVRAASFAVTAQLVLLAWFVLFLIIAATGDERSGEIALAKLRGMSPRATLFFGLAEPFLLLLAALPIGLALAYAADVFLVSRFFGTGTAVALTGTVVVALAVCFFGGVAAAALAARGILTAPVLEQLRRTGGRRAKLVRSSAIDAAAIALAAAGIYELKNGGSDALALVAPGLIALAAGLLAVRVLPWFARIDVSRTRQSTDVASFLSSRNIARRPSGLRIVVLLSLAVGLAVFAVDGWTVAAANRSDLARAEIGAPEVLHVHAPSPGGLLSAVATADPSGTQAMAAVGSDNGDGGLLAVDAQRLAAVSTWDPTWVGLARNDIGAALHPKADVAPLPIANRLSVTATYVRKVGDTDMLLRIVVRNAAGTAVDTTLGVLRPGTATYSAELPTCVDHPCTLTAIVVSHPVGVVSRNIRGTVALRDARDSAGPVDLTFGGQGGWRSGTPSTAVPIDAGADVESVADGVLLLKVDVQSFEDAGIEVNDHPIPLPIVQGSNRANDSTRSTDFPVVAGLDGRYVATADVGSGVLPRQMRQGAMVDLPYALAAMGTQPNPLDYQVWLSPSAAPGIRDALVKQGLDVISVESIAEREAQLDRGGGALSLRLFLLAALVALVLGAGTLLANAYVVIRRRAYELAALRAIGAPRSVLVRSARREQVTLALTGLALGAASGLVAAGFALPPLLESAGGDGPPLWYGPAWPPVIVLVAAVLVLLVVVADVGARRTVRRALPELLRQVQE